MCQLRTLVFKEADSKQSGKVLWFWLPAAAWRHFETADDASLQVRETSEEKQGKTTDPILRLLNLQLQRQRYSRLDRF
jgi:hypothetical protein